MNLIWTKGLKTEAEKEQFKKDLGYFLATPFVTRLLEILDEEERILSTKETTLDAYQDNSWAYRQAHINGSRQVIQKLKGLLK